MCMMEVGIEQEFFLLDKKEKIMEPSKFGFPADEMGFLVELRSVHGEDADDVANSLYVNHWCRRAASFGLRLVNVSSMRVECETADDFIRNYRINSYEDCTRNIYGRSEETHHTGIRRCDSSEECLLTAGIHVHFTYREDDGVLQALPVEQIVRLMDEEFREDITRSGRIFGEYEYKGNGRHFEYRSLPSDLDTRMVSSRALGILYSACEGV